MIRTLFATLLVTCISLSSTQAGTLEIVLKDPLDKTTVAGVLDSPSVRLRFANNFDYSSFTVTDATPLFGQAELVDIVWSGLENMAFPDPNFPNPPFTESLFDGTTFFMGQPAAGGGTNTNAGVFQAFDASFARGSEFFWWDGTRSILSLSSDATGRFTTFGTWDGDPFNDTALWRMTLDSVDFNATATSFAAAPVPLPAGGVLLLSGLGLMGLRRRKAARG